MGYAPDRAVNLGAIMRTPRMLAAGLLLATACGNLLDPAAAVVYGNKITTAEVEDALKDFARTPEFQRLAQQGDEDALKRQFEQGYVSQLIRRAVLAPKAEELGIEVTPEEIDEELDEIKADFPSQEAFDEALAEQGLTPDQLRVLIRDRQIENELRAEVVEEVEPDEDRLRVYYENHLADYSKTRAQHILVRDRALAEEIAAELRAAPPADVDELFAKLAREHSEDQSNAEDAGDLGFFSAGQFVPEFEDAVAELDEGEISDPVETEFGWHVIRVNERRTETFEEVREEIADIVVESLQEEEWSEWLARVYEEAGVKVNPRYGVFDPESQQVVDPGAEDIPGGYETSPASPGLTLIP